MADKHAHCSWCGAAFAAGAEWPRSCPGCERVSYLNPLPVAVGLIPVADGLLTVRRAFGRHAGKLALPGGFIEVGETWQQALVREAQEEVQVEVAAGSVRDAFVLSAPDGTVLIFGETAALNPDALPPFQTNTEASERVVLTEPTELAFPLHTEAMRRWFHTRQAG